MTESTSASVSVSVSSLSVPSTHLSSVPVTDSRSYPLTRPVPVPESTSSSRSDPQVTATTSSSSSSSSATLLWLQRYACSAISSATAEAATFPLDTVKVYRQLRPDGSSASTAAAAQQVRLLSVRSLPHLYSGVSPAVYRSLVYGGITVTAYAPLRRWICGSYMDEDGKHAALWRKCVTGGLAGGAGQLVANPFDLAKSLMQQATRQRLIQQLTSAKSSSSSSSTSPARSLTMFSVWQNIIEHEGIRGLWRGVVPCVQRAAIVNGSWIAVYDHSKWLVETALSPYEDSIRPSYRIVFTYTVASQLAGIVSCIASGPMDVVKTRLMTQSYQLQKHPSHVSTATTTATATATVSSTSSHRPYKGTLDCLRRVAAEEGPSALFRGFVPSLARVGPWSLVFFLVYESMSYRMFGTSQI